LQADDIPTSKDNNKAPTNPELAVTVVDVGNDEPWLEIAIHEHGSNREAPVLPRPGNRNSPPQLNRLEKLSNKVLKRIPAYRAIAWNANGDRLQDELITRAIRKNGAKVHVNERMEFDKYDAYRKFMRDGVRNRSEELKRPPMDAFDTGEYYVSFMHNPNLKKSNLQANEIWLFIPPESQ